MINNESSAMYDLLDSLNSIEDGTADPHEAQQRFDQTRQLLEDLNDVGLEYGNLLNPEDAPMQRNNAPSQTHDIYEHYDDFAAAESLASHYAQVPGEYVFEDPILDAPAPVQQHQQQYHSKFAQPKTNWSLVTEDVKGVKNIKMYSVKSNHSGQVILDGMMMFEAAQTLVNLLNEGRNLSDAKILGIISAGLQYTTVINETIKCMRSRQKVLNESKYAEAEKLDTVIAERKAQAKALKERVLTFLVDEGYITK